MHRGCLIRSALLCCSKGPVSIKEIVLCFSRVAAGLEALHAKGIVDQDLHPGNILRSLDGTSWKKADLGNSARTRVNGKLNTIAAKDCL